MDDAQSSSLRVGSNLGSCQLVCQESPWHCIVLQDNVPKLLGRGDTTNPRDKHIPLEQLAVTADVTSRSATVEVVGNGLSYFNNEEMDPYQIYTMLEGDEIAFTADRHVYMLHFGNHQTNVNTWR